MIGGLKGEFGDLDIKYLKQKNLKMLVTNIKKLQENFAAVQEGCEISQPCKRAAKFRSMKDTISQPCEIGLQLGVIGFQ